MKNLKFITLMMVAFVLGACGGKQTQSGVRAMRGTAGGSGGGLSNVTVNPQQNPGAWGNVSVQANSDQNIAAFLSSGTVNMGNVTTNGCVTGLGQPCQVDFNVSVDPSINVQNYNALPLTQVGQNQFQVLNSPGVLTVAVYDSITGTILNGVQQSAIGAPATLVSAQTTYNGSSGSAYLVFSNAAGTVTMGDPSLQTNNINGQSFTGQISYQYNNAAGSGVLGSFSTSLCYVFSCQ